MQLQRAYTRFDADFGNAADAADAYSPASALISTTCAKLKFQPPKFVRFTQKTQNFMIYDAVWRIAECAI
jgi:hypothetical protein